MKAQARSVSLRLSPRPSPWRKLALACSAVVACSGALHAQTVLTWAPNGAVPVYLGIGDWDLLGGSWTANGGASYQAWPTVGGADFTAAFVGEGNVVTVKNDLIVGGLRLGMGYQLDPLSPAVGSVILASTTAAAPRVEAPYPNNSGNTYYESRLNVPLAGVSGINIDGYGTVIFNGANTLTGGINISRTIAKLSLEKGSFLATNAVNFGGFSVDGKGGGGGGSLVIDNLNTTSNKAQSFASLNVLSGDATVQTIFDTAGSASLSATFGSMTRAAATTINFAVTDGANGTTNKINVTSLAAGFVSPTAYFNGGEFAWKTSASGGYIRGINYGSDSGTATSGTTASITPGANVHFQTTGNVTAQTTATMQTLKLGGNLTLTSGATLTLNSLVVPGSGITGTGSSTSRTISGGTALTPALDTEMDIRVSRNYLPSQADYEGSTTLTINTPIVANGTNALVKSGRGTLVLGTANTYTGTTYLNGGALRLANAAALPATSNVQFNGGVIEIAAGAPTAFTVGTGPGQVQWIGDGGFAASGGARSLTLNGGASLAWGATGFVPSGNALVLRGSGSNALTLTNAIDLGAGMHPILTGGNVTLPGVLSGPGGIEVLGDNSGTVTLSGVNNHTGGVRIHDMGLTVTNSSALGTGPLSLSGTGFAPLFMATTPVTLSNDIHIAVGPYSMYQFGGTQNLVLNGVISGDGPGIGLTGSNTITLNGNNTFTGEFQLSSATVVVGHNNALGAGRVRLQNIIRGDGVPHTIPNSGTYLELVVTGSSDLTFAGTLVNEYASPTTTLTVSNTGTTTFSNLTLGDTSQQRTVTMSTGTGAKMVVNGVISNSTTFITTPANNNIIKIGAGTLTLNGANTYSGTTSVTGGVLEASTLTDGGVAGSLGKAPVAASNLVINGGTLRYTGAGSTTNRFFQIGTNATIEASGTGAVVFNGVGNVAFGTNNQARNLVLGGANTANNTLGVTLNNNGSGVVTLTKNGAGTWVVSGNNAFTGATTINGGILKLGAAGSAGNSPLGTAAGATTVASGGTLDLNGRTLAIAEGLTLSGSGFTADTGALSNSSATDVSYSGVVTIGAGGASIGGLGNLTLGTALVTNANGLTKVGPGTLILSGTSGRTGATTVSGGTLVVAGSISASTLTSVTLGGKLSGTGTVGNVNVATGGILAPGTSPGVLNVTGAVMLQSGSFSSFEIGGLTRGTQYDGLEISGGLTLGGTLQITLTGGFVPAEGNVFNLFNSATSTGAFDAYNLPSLTEGLSWNTDTLSSQGEITVVPEPGSAVLLLGGVALLVRRRRDATP